MTRTLPLLILLSMLAGTAAGADTSVLHNAEIHPLGAPDPDLERAFATLLETSADSAWATYTTRQVAGGHSLCCGRPGICSLERGNDCCWKDETDDDSSPILRVMLRLEDRRLTDVRTFSATCPLDAGGKPVYVWGEVDPAASQGFLTSQAAAGSRRLAEHALMAVAQHEGREASQALERVARGELLPRLEEEAIFWLGEARGQEGLDSLIRLRDELRDRDLREHLTFALHLNDAPDALPTLIDTARNDRDPEVRGQALFWLSQQAGDRAADAIAEAGEEDPDLEVKERAVFALSQLPPDRGVPLLIHYAESHPQREIRKKAIFWLGQSEDSRALDFFEQILLR